MNNVFGITTQNMLTTQQSLQKHAKNIQIVDVEHRKLNRKRLKKADLILAANVKSYNTLIASVNKRKQTIIVFDSPLVMSFQDEIQVLDHNKSEVLNINFANTPIDYSLVIKTLKKPNVNAITRNKTDILGEIIKKYSASGFMDKFNTYIYQATTLRSKSAVRNDIVQFVFGKTTVDTMLTNINKHGGKTGPESMQLLQQIIDYMQSNSGSMLQKALLKALEMENAASKNARRIISYKKLTDEFHVDKFELRNLLLLYRNKA